MGTIAKYQLNPLATCFVPLSMKVPSENKTNVFPIIDYEKAIADLLKSKKEMFPLIGNKQTVTNFFGNKKALADVAQQDVISDTFGTTEETVTDAVQGEAIGFFQIKGETVTNAVHEKSITNIFEITKETLTDSVREAIVTEESFTTAKESHSPVRETHSDKAGRATHKKLNGDEISDERSKTGTRDMNVMELDLLLPKKLVNKISETEILKQKTTLLEMKWSFKMPRAVNIDSYYRLEFSATAMYLKMLLTSVFLPITKSDRKQITYQINEETEVIDSEETEVIDSEETEVIDSEETKYECQCPPAFGWIVPPDLLGNPLKLTDTCKKKFIHTSYVDESQKHREIEDFTEEDDQSSDMKDVITLEQCSSELKTIIKDVCDSVNNTLLSFDQCSKEPRQTEVSETRKKRPVWNTPTETERSKLEIIDDGSHPLLQEAQFEDNDTEMSKIQAILGHVFSPGKPLPESAVLNSQSACIPPCSYWCNHVPLPAKDAYKKFYQKESQSISNRNASINRKVLRRPLYKRCFSADDTPKTSDYDKKKFQSASSCESRERFLFRKDPAASVKNTSNVASNDFNRKQKSSKFSTVFEQVTKDIHSSENTLDSWSPYDGADSMWQPLPDCVPLSDQAQKNSHRRARDMRRQRSVC